MKKRILLVCLGICASAFILGTCLFGRSGTLNVLAPAVNEEGLGRMAEFSLSAKQGSGSTLVDVKQATYDEDTEIALSEARKAARKVVGGKMDSLDISLSAARPGSVSGRSASVLWAIAMVAVAEGRDMREEATISAVFCGDEYKELCPVGGIEEKIWAAQKIGKRVFVVSQKQAIAHEDEFVQMGIEVRRAETFEDALKIMLEP